MYGWRGRFAHLSPSRGDILVHEFYAISPPGVMLVNTTGTVRHLRDDDLSSRMAGLEAAARDTAAERLDLIVAGGSPIVTMQGYGAEKRIAERLTEACGTPCVMGIQLEVEALRAMGSTRPALATPYPPELDERLIRYLREAGFDVQGCVGLGIENNSEIGALPEWASLKAGRQALRQAPRADALFMPCARWPTQAAIPMLEAEFGVPVASGTSAVLYGAFRRLRITGDFARFGRLLGSLRPGEIPREAATADDGSVSRTADALPV